MPWGWACCPPCLPCNFLASSCPPKANQRPLITATNSAHEGEWGARRAKRHEKQPKETKVSLERQGYGR